MFQRAFRQDCSENLPSMRHRIKRTVRRLHSLACVLIPSYQRRRYRTYLMYFLYLVAADKLEIDFLPAPDKRLQNLCSFRPHSSIGTGDMHPVWLIIVVTISTTSSFKSQGHCILAVPNAPREVRPFSRRGGRFTPNRSFQQALLKGVSEKATLGQKQLDSVIREGRLIHCGPMIGSSFVTS